MHPNSFVPTAEQRTLVEQLSKHGIPQADICRVIGCSPPTLRVHFREELDNASVAANLRVAQTLFSMATSGENVAASIFWMKSRAGWSERVQMEHSGPGGGPIQLEAIDRPPSETREEWLARRQRELAKARLALEPPAGAAE